MDLLEEIKEGWCWVGLDPLQLVAENDFGNLLIKDHSGRYWRLCPEDCYCEIVAWDEASYDALVNDPEFKKDWLMAALVRIANEKHGPLVGGRKYCLVVPGILGGAYDISNIKTAPLSEIVRRSGDLSRQIRDLPDGAKIRLKVVD